MAFLAELKAAGDKRNAEDLARRKALGLVWEPTGDAGGYEVAAVFSSSELWNGLVDEVRDGVRHEQTIHARDIVHLHHALNMIAASGGSATFAAGAHLRPPHWPTYDAQAVDGIAFRENSFTHLANHGYITVEKGAGTMTLTFGPKTKALAASFHETVGRKAD